MKNFADFERLLTLYMADEDTITGIRQKVEVRLPDDLPPVQLAMDTAVGVSAEIMVASLKLYHQWLHEED